MKCNPCFWVEGGRCYIDPCVRDGNGLSIQRAISRCAAFESKREVMERVTPKYKLNTKKE